MSTTETKPRTLPVIDGWVVRDLPNGDQVRARLRVDEYGDTMEPDRDGTGVLLVRESSGYHSMDLDEHDGLARVLDRIGNDGRYWYVTREAEDQERMFEPDMGIRDYWKRIEHELKGGADEAREFVRRYLRAFWDVEDAFMFEHQGYSQSSWSDIWVIVERPVLGALTAREYAEAIAREWSDWAKGDCYYVEIEHRSLADAMEAEDSDDMWSGFESYGSGIGDDGARCLLHDALYVHPFGGVDIAALPEPYEVTK